MLRAPRLMSTGGHAELSRGYPGLRLAVTYEDDLGMFAREADAVGDQTRHVRGAHPGWRHVTTTCGTRGVLPRS